MSQVPRVETSARARVGDGASAGQSGGRVIPDIGMVPQPASQRFYVVWLLMIDGLDSLL
ncbi:hypothetical protein [Lysobacter capsici]|uniref:hypothetical protein n=1 Tax=Lysobacter capsici TaxID=435897 RepID=UPI001364D0B1|nr:hypothetical protein [Lysobacter capsici]